MSVVIRPERAGDENAVSQLITRAFLGAPHASGDEARIVERLREDGDLEAAYVAIDGGLIVGHVAFSPVGIDGAECGWYGLGPVAVVPERQREGIGGGLVEHGLVRLHAGGAAGCFVLGNPAYYRRFGFDHDPALTYPGVPEKYFQRLVFDGEAPRGTVAYAPVFG